MISDEKKEEVRQASDIVDVVSDYVKLRKSGNNFSGLCPFHNEKTPSFNVSPSLGIYKCFGCGEGGDVFNFVMKIDGVGFEEAVRSLAARSNVFIPEKQEDAYDPQQHLKDGIYHALRFSGKFFYQTLVEADEAENARAYLNKRGYPWKTITRFGLGYAPEGYDSLIKAAEKAGINMHYLHESGLVKARGDDSGFYDTFRSRLMFPIFNPAGKVIAFGGRTLSSDKKTPKYINSPQTPVYNKSEVLYGIHAAKNEIRKAGEVILVEGYTDVISMHQADIKNVVSTSGTSLTSGQVRIMKRYGDIILMIFDADTAGLRAAVRGISIALEEGMAVRVLTLPEGEDPDSFVKQFGEDGFREYKKKKSLDFLRFLVDHAQKQEKWEDPIERRKSINEILESIAVIPDEITRTSYVQELGGISRIGDRALHEELGVIRARILENRRIREARGDRNRMEGQDRRGRMKPESRTEGSEVGRPASSAGNRPDSPVQRGTGSTGGPPDRPHPPLEEYESNTGNGYRDDAPPPAGNTGVLSGSGKSRQISSRSEGFQVSTRDPGKQVRLPAYEKELIRLMLVFGNKLIEFIGSYSAEDEFEDPGLRRFYQDIMQVYLKGGKVSVDAYSRREHPYPELVGEIVLDRYWVSELGMKKRGVFIKKDSDPLKTARGALKSLKIRYLEKIRERTLEEYKSAQPEEKKKIYKKNKEAASHLSRFRRESAEALFPDV